MAKATYTKINFTTSVVTKALAAVEKAEKEFQKVALDAAVNGKLIPNGMHGKIVRSRFGGEWQLAISDQPFSEYGSAAAVSL